MADDVLACYPAIDPSRVEVIYNGVDTDAWRPDPGTEVLEAHGVDPGRPLVVFVGRITRQKGLAHLLEAAPLIDPAAQLVVCAGAADTEALAAEIRRLAARAERRPGGLVWIEQMLARHEVAQLLSHREPSSAPRSTSPSGS